MKILKNQPKEFGRIYSTDWNEYYEFANHHLLYGYENLDALITSVNYVGITIICNEEMFGFT